MYQHGVERKKGTKSFSDENKTVPHSFGLVLCADRDGKESRIVRAVTFDLNILRGRRFELLKSKVKNKLIIRIAERFSKKWR